MNGIKIKICDLIESLWMATLIPAIILWKNLSRVDIIVIDGAHRLSAILAYINDDYGIEKYPKRYFNYQIPDEEKELAQECKQYTKDKVGSFETIIKFLKNNQNIQMKEVIKGSEFHKCLIKNKVIE